MNEEFINENTPLLDIANLFGLRVVKLQEEHIDSLCLDYFPFNLAKKYSAIPLRIERNRLLFAVRDPSDLEAIKMINFITNKTVELVVASKDEIDWAINKYYASQQSNDAIEEILRSTIHQDKSDELTEIDIEHLGMEHPVVRLVHNIIIDAIHRNASDIHIRPEEKYVDLILRIDGSLVKVQSLDRDLLPGLIGRIKIIGDMNIAERRVPQDGRANYIFGQSMVDMRISIMPTVHGESAVIRILDSSAGMKKLEDLGLSKEDQWVFSDLLNRSYGMFLVTGPTGSGKTTTLYAALQEIIKRNVNVITVENPVEYQIEHVEQIQINPLTGYTFAKALKNILRHDPDVIMVGEIRDEETAKIAVESALTGHLVLSTLHTNDAAGAITRLSEIGVEPYLVESTLLGVLAQRLVRKNCLFCVQEENISDSIREALGVSKDEVFYRGTGCNSCNGTGYHGTASCHRERREHGDADGMRGFLG